jgi:hypothetical protein
MRLLLVFVVALLTLLAGCTFMIPTPGEQTRPDDFHLTYRWQEGSLPPPYHYEYTITISSTGQVSPTGQGEIVMIPDYDFNEPPTWTEAFTADAEQMDTLYSTLVANGLLSQRWRAQGDPPVGGSSQSVTAMARGQTYAIPSFVPASQENAAANIAAAIEAFVPQAIWDKLEAQREQYMEEHFGQ